MNSERSLHYRALRFLRDSLQDEEARFHENQWDAISILVEERGRLLVVQATGWGKSAVYFIAARLLREQGRGPTLIISPLLALMRNQIESALEYGVKLGAINSANEQHENDQVERELLAGHLDAVIVSPERLANSRFMDEVLRPIASSIGLLVVDEAHCISNWGHDFRPDYKRIRSILGFLPNNMPVLATTATANERVMDDITAQLGDSPRLLRGHLTRDSLHLQTLVLPKRSLRLAWLAETLPTLEGTGIIYVATTRDAELVADWLKKCGIEAEAYYGSLKGLSPEANRAERLRREDALMKNEIKALVATSALGMGYDKPDLAFVIHFQSPGSVISYYQQVGRAGRGIPKAYGVLFSGGEDDDIQRHFIRNAVPQQETVLEILNALEESDGGMKLNELQLLLNERPARIAAAVRYLASESPAPIIKEDGLWLRSVDDYELPLEAIKRILEVKEREWEAMQAYIEHEGCLMQYLAQELDDSETTPCGKCQNCMPQPPLPAEVPFAIGQAAADFVGKREIDIQPRKRAGNRSELVMRFPKYQFEPSFGELAHEPGRALCRWGEAGWGEIAMKGKRAHRFDPRLVKASAKMISERWDRTSELAWVTFVPSSAHPALVADFARALAEQLGLPCVDVVKKVGKNKPQKEMENTSHQCNNLDGVFEVSSDVLPGAVLLVDDAVDSRWTFAVISALLRRADSGPVFPFAVMDTSTGG